MSDLPANERREDDGQPMLLGRIRPIAEIFFGAYAVCMILRLARDFWLAISSQI